VTAAGCPADHLARLRAGLLAALADPDLEACRAALLLIGATVLPAAAYRPLAALAAGHAHFCRSEFV
jgi:hypothetical protein